MEIYVSIGLFLALVGWVIETIQSADSHFLEFMLYSILMLIVYVILSTIFWPVILIAGFIYWRVNR